MIRYPVERIKYCKTVGRTRVENIAEILRSLDGFDATAKDPEAHDVDVGVFKDSQPVQVIEVLNWKRKSYLSFKRTMSIIENLNASSYFGLNKLLVFSFWENIRNLRMKCSSCGHWNRVPVNKISLNKIVSFNTPCFFLSLPNQHLNGRTSK